MAHVSFHNYIVIVTVVVTGVGSFFMGSRV